VWAEREITTRSAQRACLGTGFNIPDFQRGVEARPGKMPTIWAVCHRKPGSAADGMPPLARCRVPELDSPICVVRRSKISAIGTKSHLRPSLMEGEGGCTGRCVPDLHRVVQVGCSDLTAVGADGHATGLESLERPKFSAARCIP